MGDPMEGAHAASTGGHLDMRAGSRRESVHLSVVPTTLTLSNVSGVEPVPQRNEEITPG